jgi:hypothetical protein
LNLDVILASLSINVILLCQYLWCENVFVMSTCCGGCHILASTRMPPATGQVRTMCGSRTGGWSLPCVMSDWQHCVDWFLAKYCRCRLRLDWCWCRWRTSVKGRRRWGL